MIAIIQVLTPTGSAVTLETDAMKLDVLIENLPKIEARLEEAGYEILAGPPQPAPVTVTVNGAATQQNTFAARELVCEVLDKKPYWKIMGPPPYHKFGLRVWPETLEEAGIDVDSLNPLTGLDLTGWTATWEARPGKDGQTKKVVVGLNR